MTLPADGAYSIELHDELFRPAAGFFRLKVGDLQFADLALPLGVAIGGKQTIECVSTNIRASAELNAAKLNFERVNDLSAKGFATKAQLDQATAALHLYANEDSGVRRRAMEIGCREIDGAGTALGRGTLVGPCERLHSVPHERSDP
jgi:glucokinase